MRQDSVRRRLVATLAVLLATAGLATAMGAPAMAAPGDGGGDGEGSPKSLIEQVSAASSGYVKAKRALDASKKRQKQLAGVLKKADSELGPRQAALDEIARQSYRTGRLGAITAILTSTSTGTLLDRAETLETVAVKQDRALREVKQTRDTQQRAKTAVDLEIKDQQKQVTTMAKRKTQAEDALKAANRGGDADSGSSGGSSSGSSGGASSGGGTGPVDGSCSVAPDPTTGSNCITPTLNFALNDAKAAGFNHFVACFREESSGEHPQGKACDFAADEGGFGGVASGASRTYGDNLADYFINSASRLHVLYVIWFQRIWLPSSGWQAYENGNGDPSSEHQNHVHLSVE